MMYRMSIRDVCVMRCVVHVACRMYVVCDERTDRTLASGCGIDSFVWYR